MYTKGIGFTDIRHMCLYTAHVSIYGTCVYIRHMYGAMKLEADRVTDQVAALPYYTPLMHSLLYIYMTLVRCSECATSVR